MKIVKNTSMQGHYVTFKTPEGVFQKFIGPKKSIKVPNSWGGKILENFIKRRIVKVTTTQELDSYTPQTETYSKRRKYQPKKSN